MKNEEEVRQALCEAIKEALQHYVDNGGNLKELPWFNYKLYKDEEDAKRSNT